MSGVKLPEGWVKTSLEEIILTIVGGGTPSKTKPEYYQGDIPWMSVKDMNKHILVGTVDHITQDAVKNSSTNVIPAGIPIIATRMSLGKIVTASFDCAINQDLKALFLSKYIYRNFFIHWYRSQAQLIESLGTGTTVKGIRLEVLKALLFPLVPLTEQKIIADKLDTLLAQVDSTKARLEQIPQILKRFRQAVLAAAVSGKLTEEWRQKHTEINVQSLDLINEFWENIYGENGKRRPISKIQGSSYSKKIPKKWLSTRLGQVFDVFVGATPSRAEPSFWNGNIPWVSSSEVAFCKITKTKEAITELGLGNASTSVHPAGTVMLAMIGQGKTRGQAAILEIEACHNQNTAALRVPAGFVLSEYLYYFLVQQYEETRRIGGGNNQQALNKSFVQSMGFPLPPIKEQTEIVRRVEQLFAYADGIEKQVQNALERVNNLTQSILAKAFRGELTAQWRAENPDLISGENSAQALLAKIQQQRANTKIAKRGFSKR